MNEIKLRGIVLRETMTGEADKFITLFAKGRGKVSVFCRGARSIRSKNMSGTALFCYGDFIVSPSRNNYNLKSVDTIESFYTLRNDLSTLSYATYFAEFADKVTPEESPNDDVLLLLLKSLKQLTAQKISNSLIARIYELKIMQFCGYTPYLQSCCECGSEEVKFIGTEGLLCEKCAKFLPTVEVNYNIIYVLAYILSADLNHLFTFGVSDETQALLEKINNMLVACHLSLNLKSYKFIKDNNL